MQLTMCEIQKDREQLMRAGFSVSDTARGSIHYFDVGSAIHKHNIYVNNVWDRALTIVYVIGNKVHCILR